MSATTGFLLGKFLPPHRGHQYLIDVARQHVDHLTVLVCTVAREPIPGHLRYRWMCEAFPGVCLVHHTDEIPQTPDEHPRFWEIWQASIRRHVPWRIDYVFASEDYGWRLAEVLGAQYIPVDPARTNVPVSGRAIRADPMRHWDDLLPPVRPYYLRRVGVLGPGAEDLAVRLAAQFRTVCLRSGSAPAAAEAALARQANRILICAVEAGPASHPYDLYLFTGAAAEHEAAPERPFRRLSGSGEERLRQAGEAVEQLIAAPPASGSTFTPY